MGGERKEPVFGEVRRYFCDYCGICRSKKSHVNAHMLSHHQYQVGNLLRSSIKWPQSHTTCFERPFTCPVDDCHSSYRRKVHLTRHLLKHQGKLFTCPVQNCNSRFAFQSSIKRHVKEFHDESPPNNVGSKQYVCSEIGCGKVFKFASKLQTHEDSHVKLDLEVVCSEPGCFKHFTNEQCLKTCGTKQLRKNIKRHLRTHKSGCSSEGIRCHFKGCLHTFSTKTRCHVYTHGDLEELDEQFRQRPRGGRKRKSPPVEALLRKRVTPPSQSDSILSV
ncbi:hypothetical protein PVL29_021444 [Vitis rotundifolia]|uniref:C2H2-type domain-containing protein n=1 Tax=Vitis rotundifolia TaxID=103349 RepID=A0AA39DDA3_VITRO|nr:hypothetical protein PVL29_021444 [Vitis rotundifolia]